MKRKRLLILSIVFIVVLFVLLLARERLVSKNTSVDGIIAAGDKHVLALKNDGTVAASGDNSFGQCNVEEWEDIVKVYAGGYSSFGLKSDGTVLVAGTNYNGILDVDDWENIVDISANLKHTVGLKIDGTVVAVGNNSNGQCDVLKLRDIVEINTGYSTTTAVDKNGNLFFLGQRPLGMPFTEGYLEDIRGARSFQADMFMYIALFDNNDLIVNMDSNYHYYEQHKDIIQFDHMTDTLIMLKNDGSVKVDWHSKEVNQELINSNWMMWRNIIDIEAGEGFIVGLKEDGTVVAAGENEHGQCDVEEWTDIATEPLPMDIDNDNK